MTRIVYRLPIDRSISLTVYLISIHLLSLMVVMTLPLLLLWQLVLLLLVLLSFSFCYCRHLNTGSAYFICGLERDAEERWHLRFADGSSVDAVNLTRCVVTPFASVLYFKTEKLWLHKVVFITHDAVDDELFRQLRVYCRDVKTFQQ